MTGQFIRIRRAARSDEAALRAMQERSFRALGRARYRLHQIEAFISVVGTVDSALLEEGRYFLAESGDGILACGGWSLSKPAYAAHAGCPEAHSPEAHSPEVAVHRDPVVRAVYVRPDAARLGFGRWIVRTVEADVRAEGFALMTLTSMLSAVAFYERLGFVAAGDVTFALPGGVDLACVHMRKALTVAMPRRRAA